MSLLSPPRKNALTPAQRRLYANALARDNALAGAVGAPGGLLEANALQPAPSPNYLKAGLLAGSFAPGLGDGLGLLGDLHMYATEPESRTPLNFGLSALGVLPFVPGVAIVKGLDDLVKSIREPPKITQGALLKIKRPGGVIEDVINTQHAKNGVIPDALFKKMQDATRQAGRGEILSQSPNATTMPLSAIREEITGRLSALADQFPSAQKTADENTLIKALDEFDALYPEVAQQIKADRSSRTGNAVNRALRGED